MNKAEIGIALRVIASMLKVKKQEHDEGIMTLFSMAIEDHPFQDVMSAIKKLNSEGVKYMLEPHHIVEAMGQSPEELEMEAREEWIEFRNAVVSRPNPKFDNVVTAYIAQKILNIFECKNMSDDQFYRKENTFIKAYTAGDKIVPDIKDQCLRGEIKTISESAMEWLQDEENNRLGIGDDGKQIGGGN